MSLAVTLDDPIKCRIDDSYLNELEAKKNIEDIYKIYADSLPIFSSSSKSPETFNEYKILRKIGEGIQADVYLAQKINIDRVEEVAIKIFKNDLEGRENGRREASFLMNELLGIPHVSQARAIYKSSESQYALVFDYLREGDLHKKYIEDRGKPQMTISQIRSLMKQMIETLLSMKDKKVIYGDMKPENTFFSDSEELKIVDFGLTVKDINEIAPFIPQTYPYLAPEVMLMKKITHDIDIWSLGCMIFNLYTKKILFNIPFYQSSEQDFIDAFYAHKDTLGMPLKSYVEEGKTSDFFFDKEERNLQFNYLSSKKYQDYIKANPFLHIEEEIMKAAIERNDDMEEARNLARLIAQMIKYEDRISLEKMKIDRFINPPDEKMKSSEPSLKRKRLDETPTDILNLVYGGDSSSLAKRQKV